MPFGTGKTSTMKILTADDDPLSRRLLEKTLLQAGYETRPVPFAINMLRTDGVATFTSLPPR
jgi:CheY-like chemotaxis protein